MRNSTKVVLETMIDGIPKKEDEKIEKRSDSDVTVSDVIQKVKEIHKPYWKCFNV